MIKQCEFEKCQKTFEAQRRDARYCSPVCRASASRDRKKEEAEAEEQSPSDMAPKPSGSVANSPAAENPSQETKPTPESATDSEADSHLDSTMEALLDRVDDVEDLFFEARNDSVQRQKGVDQTHASIHRKLADLAERLDRLERMFADGADTEDLFDKAIRQGSRIEQLEVGLLKLRQVVTKLGRRLQEVDEAAAAAVSLLAGVE